MIDPGRRAAVPGDARLFNFKGQHHGGHGLGVIQVEDEVAQTVGDEFPLVRFETLQHVGVVIDQNVGAHVDGHPSQLAIVWGRFDPELEVKILRTDFGDLDPGRSHHRMFMRHPRRSRFVLVTAVGLDNHDVRQGPGIVDGAIELVGQKIGEAGLVITRVQERLIVPLPAGAVAEAQKAHPHTLFRPESRQQRHVIRGAGPAVPDIQQLQPVHGVEHADFAVVGDVVVTQGHQIDPGVGQAGNIRRLTAEHHALGGMPRAPVGVRNLQVGHVDVGGLAENVQRRGEQGLDPVGVDDPAIVFVTAAGEDVADEVHRQRSFGSSGRHGYLAGVAGGQALRVGDTQTHRIGIVCMDHELVLGVLQITGRVVAKIPGPGVGVRIGIKNFAHEIDRHLEQFFAEPLLRGDGVQDARRWGPGQVVRNIGNGVKKSDGLRATVRVVDIYQLVQGRQIAESDLPIPADGQKVQVPFIPGKGALVNRVPVGFLRQVGAEKSVEQLVLAVADAHSLPLAQIFAMDSHLPDRRIGHRDRGDGLGLPGVAEQAQARSAASVGIATGHLPVAGILILIGVAIQNGCAGFEVLDDDTPGQTFDREIEHQHQGADQQ